MCYCSVGRGGRRNRNVSGDFSILRMQLIAFLTLRDCVSELIDKSNLLAGRRWHTPLIPVLGRQRQMDLCEFKVSLVTRASSRTGSKVTEKPCL